MRRIIVLLLLSSLAGVSALFGQEEPPADKEATGTKISIHGYLTQAYARSDGHQILGITRDGTSDYRTAALQIRTDLTADDAFVVQLSHERLGESPFYKATDDVELDWIFYLHQIGSTSIKVGRAPIPFGIYNEVRDVSTLLPFFRPPHNFYGEISYSSESLDGVIVSHDFDLGSGWGLESDLYYGSFKLTERDPQGRYLTSDARDSLGTEVWLDTPVSGLRIGAGGLRYDVDSPNPMTGRNRWTAWHGSVAGDFERFAIHGEAKEIDIGSLFDIRMAYLHLGVGLTGKLTLNLQKEASGYAASGLRWRELDDDRAVGLSYALSPTLLAQAEHHWNQDTGIWLEDQSNLIGRAVETRYWIVNLSTSF